MKNLNYKVFIQDTNIRKERNVVGHSGIKSVLEDNKHHEIAIEDIVCFRGNKEEVEKRIVWCEKIGERIGEKYI